MWYDKKMIDEIKDILVKREETVAVAESVTSGHLQAAFSLADDATFFFQGGLTAYNIGQKTRHLQIDPIYGDKVNCISQPIANKMAKEVAEKFISDYGIGITGFATLVPECGHEGLHAFFAISYRGQNLIGGKLKSSKSNSLDAQVDYTLQVLTIFRKHLSG